MHREPRRAATRMVNTPESSQPDDPHYVLPRRRDDEPVEQYVRRVRDAAESI